VNALFEPVFEKFEDKLVAKLETYDHRLAGCRYAALREVQFDRKSLWL